jgi:potassium efflux system protein
MENRIQVISELHTEIARRFEAAEIEIPFPQRDLHLRSAEASLRLERESTPGTNESQASS